MGYSGSIPMKLFGTSYTYESIDATSGYIKGVLRRLLIN